MNLVHNSDFLQSEKIIGISVGKSAPDQLHNKLLINFNNVQGELHLEFHHILTFSETFENPEMYIWDIPAIPESRLKSLAARCIKVIKNIEFQDVPYAIEYKGRRKFDKEGIYNSYSSGDEYGVTCATFILTLFDSVGIDLLDWQNWENRDDEDNEWFTRLIRIIEIERGRGRLLMSDEHFNNLKSEENCKKIRPEEVFASVFCNNLPINFLCSSTMGTNIRNYLIGLS